MAGGTRAAAPNGGKTKKRCIWNEWMEKSKRNGARGAIHWITHNPEYEERLKKGESTTRYLHGDSYRGYWKNDQKEGYGIQVWKDGRKYEGEWWCDHREGKGTLWIMNSRTRRYEKRYIGNWRDDKKDGLGIHYFSTQSTYEGYWQGGKRNGRGRMIFENRDVYEGNWEEDQRSGPGVMIFANGDRYEGYWKCNQQEGPGRYFYHTTGKVYEGEWLAGNAKCGFLMDAPVVDDMGMVSSEGPLQSTQNFSIPPLKLKNPDDVIARAIDEVRESSKRLEEEVVKIDAEISLTEEDLTVLQRTYSQAVAEGDGVIYAGSLGIVLESLGLEVSYDQLLNVFSFLGKGEEDPVDFTEFCRLMSNLKV